MDWIARHFRWLMLVSGLLTATTFYGLFAPEAALQSLFGASFSGALESILVRSWSALVGLMGLVLIVGALAEHLRLACALLAALSKAIFITLLLVYGQAFLAQAAAALLLDGLVILCTLLYLLALRSRSQSNPA